MKTQEGHLSTILQVDTFKLYIADDVILKEMRPFLIKVDFEYYAPIAAKDFEEPDVEEYISLEKISTVNDVYLSDGRGIMLHISGYGQFLDLLDEVKYSKICDALSLKQDGVKL